MTIGRSLSEMRTHPMIRLAVLAVIFDLIIVSLSTSHVEAQKTLAIPQATITPDFSNGSYH